MNEPWSAPVVTKMSALGVALMAFVILQLDSSTEIIPERAQIDYYDRKYLTNVTAYIKRYARRSPYYINVEGTLLQTIGDNITIHGVFYEYLHNEYKRSFVEITINMCDLFHKKPWKDLLGTALLARGATCPAFPAIYIFHNLTISTKHFPYVWPFEKVMFQAYAQHKPSQDIVVRASFYLMFKRPLDKKTNA